MDEIWVAFSSSFDGSRFVSVGSIGPRVGGDGGEELADPVVLRGGVCGGVPVWQPSEESLLGACETDTLDVHLVCLCGLNQQGTNPVVGNRMHRDFLAHHPRRLAAQDIHAEREGQNDDGGLPETTPPRMTDGLARAVHRLFIEQTVKRSAES
jgi:hypothetical protein